MRRTCCRCCQFVWLLLVVLWGIPATAQELGIAPPAYESTPWVYTGGPVGGLGYDVRLDPRNPDVMYVTDAWAGVFKSLDGGATWFPSSEGITARAGPSGDGIPVFSLTIDPNNPDTLWAGTQFASGVFRSDDAGATWRNMSGGVNNGSRRGILERALTIRGFGVQPGNSDVVYLAGEVSSWEWSGQPLPGLGLDMVKGVVYKSVDGGQNWTRIWSGDNLARYVWIDPRDPDRLYVSTGIFDREAANSDAQARDPGGVGVLRSRDGGATWDVLGVEHGFHPDDLYVGSLYLHPENPGVLLAAAGNDPYMWYLGRPMGGVYRTDDGGDTWTEVLDEPNMSAVEICEGDPQVVYAGSAGGFFRSDDGGHAWRQLGGEFWGPEDIVAGFPIDMQCDPRDANRIFVNNYGGGNFLSEDGGQTWRDSSRGYTGALMRQVAVAADDPARVYATARSGVFASEDGGQTWHGLSRGVARAMEALALAVDPQDSLHILASVGDAGPWLKVSRDGGQAWRDVDAPTGMGAGLWKLGVMASRIVFSPVDPQVVYVTVGDPNCARSGECEVEAGQGVLISRDGGETWAPTGLDRGHVLDLAVSTQDRDRLYAAVYEEGVYRSDDGGATWQRAGQDAVRVAPTPIDPDMPGPALVAITVAPDNLDKAYAGFFRGGVAISHDGGVTWQPSSAGMPAEASVCDLAVDPTRPDVVYAATEDSGVYLSLDGGSTWRVLNDGLHTRTARDLALSADGSVLYLATEGGGVLRLGAPSARPGPTEPAPEMPTAPSLTPAPTAEPSADGGLCGGVAALPLLFLGLIWLQRRRR